MGLEVAIAAVEGARLSLLVSAEAGGPPIPRARRFPFLVVCEAFQVQRGLAMDLPAGWRLPPRADAGARAADHPFAAVLARYRLDRDWRHDEREDDFSDDALIAGVDVREAADHAVIELDVVDPALLRHLVPGTSWRIGWW